MKYLLILALVVLVAWQWRGSRVKNNPSRMARNQRTAEPTEMVVCSHCGVHLPAQDSIKGKAGVYCDARHRDSAEH